MLPRLNASKKELPKGANKKDSLADAHLILARELGFESWPKLKHQLQGDPEDALSGYRERQ